MPSKDTTGPQGKGPGSGRGSGDCTRPQQNGRNRRFCGQRNGNQKNGQCRRIRGQGQEFRWNEKTE
jgi:hypothetical protein